MKHIVLLLGFFLASVFPAYAITTNAEEAFMIDLQTRTVLLAKNADTRMPTSSMSKVMTMYMVFEALKDGRLSLDDTLTVSEKAWKKGGSKMFVEVGDEVKVEDLVRGVIVQSGNDATIVLAEGLNGSEDVFAEAMNARARAMGMTNSNFMNASGWPDPEHYSTARDLALLAERIIEDFPEYYPYYSEKSFKFNNIKQDNRNFLLWRNIGVDGIKTGHTEAAGYGLMSSAKRGDRRLILVVNGLSSEKERADESARLLEWGFNAFQNISLFKAGEQVDTAEVWLGEPVTVPMVIEEDVFISLPRMKKDDLEVTVTYQEPLSAPVQKGQEIGMLKVNIPGGNTQTYPLVAGTGSEKLGLIPRTLAKASYFLMGSQ